jgi:Tannase and feruloyl esterase
MANQPLRMEGLTMLQGNAIWAKGNPEKVRDYGWRGVPLTTVAAKKLIAAYYGRKPDHSYFIGCSNSGRRDMIMSIVKPGGPERQRLVCAFPKRAMLIPGGDFDKAASYTCTAPARGR